MGHYHCLIHNLEGGGDFSGRESLISVKYMAKLTFLCSEHLLHDDIELQRFGMELHEVIWFHCYVRSTQLKDHLM